MVRVCCVAGCAGDSNDTDDIRFFRFPKSDAARARWRAALGVSARVHRNTLVCSRHFARSDYGAGRLAPGCVPAVNLGDGGDDVTALAAAVGVTSQDGRLSRAREREDRDLERNSTDEDENSRTAKNDTNDINATSPKSHSDENARISPLNGFLKKDANECNANENSESPKAGVCETKSPAETTPLQNATNTCDQQDRIPQTLNTNTATEKHTESPPKNKDSKAANSPKAVSTENHSVSNLASEALHQSERLPDPDGQSKTLMDLDDQSKTFTDLDDQSHTPTSVGDPLRRDEEGLVSIDCDLDSRHTGSPDCLMLVESLQVELDPDAFYSQRDDEPDTDLEMLDDRPEEVSLLTSSDESDVVIQEPHIDTVEVSDATDEDDVPLGRLCRQATKATKATGALCEKTSDINGILWGTACEHYCYQCGHVTGTKAALREHRKTHEKTKTGREKTILVCSVCAFQSSSQSQYSRHMRKHKVEKKYRCAVCNYKAKHRMSLVYHMKVHKDCARSVLKCKQCEFKTRSRFEMQDHLTDDHGLMVYFCDACAYSTKRKSDLTRHMRTKHR